LQNKSASAKDNRESVNVGILEDREKKELQQNGQEEQILEVKKHHVEEDKLVGKLSEDAARKQVKLRNDTLSFSRNSLGLQESVPKTNKLKHVKSVQFPFNSVNSSEILSTSQLTGQVNNINVPEVASAPSHSNTESKATRNGFSDGKVELESKIEMLEEELRKAASVELALYSVVTESKATINDFSDGKVELESKIEMLEEELRKAASVELALYSVVTESKATINDFSDGKVELESKIEMLEEELQEAAAVEVALYSVVAEHGSSATKVHAPARRLSRFYLHACKARSPANRASAARTAVSGLVLVAKACGNDVPRYEQAHFLEFLKHLQMMLHY
jgi:DNA-directed RNA polymerase subunit L